MRTNMFVGLFVSAAMLSGCITTQNGGGLTLDQKVGLVRAAAQTTTILSLNQAVKDAEKRLSIAKIVVVATTRAIQAVDDKALKLTNADIQNIIDQFNDSIEPDVIALLVGASDMLLLYFTPGVSLDSVITPENLSILRAFFVGVQDGANVVISSIQVGKASEKLNTPRY